MRTEKYIRQRITEIQENYLKMIPESRTWLEKVEFVILPQINRQQVIQRTCEKLGAEEPEYLPDTIAEVISSEKGYTVLIYPENTDDLFELRFTIAHELGHVCANIANREIDEEWRYDIVCQRDTPIRSGGAVWSEFIADAIGYHITGEQFERYNISELRNHMLTLLYLSFQGKQINPVNLGHLCAFILCNRRMRKAQMQQGLLSKVDDFRPEVLNGISAIIKVLDGQIHETVFWHVSRDKLIQLGDAVDQLWNECFWYGVLL